tara:strand:- start:536 stop:835 length:300 start_codon:yes stop_codon:yes gene_type:complete
MPVLIKVNFKKNLSFILSIKNLMFSNEFGDEYKEKQMKLGSLSLIKSSLMLLFYFLSIIGLILFVDLVYPNFLMFIFSFNGILFLTVLSSMYYFGELKK